MLVNLPANVVAAMRSSNNLTINTFIGAQIASYSPTNVLKSSMIQGTISEININMSQVSATPLTASIAVTVEGIEDSEIQGSVETILTNALIAAISPLRIWSGDGMSPSEITALFDETLLNKIKADTLTLVFNGETIDPVIDFGVI